MATQPKGWLDVREYLALERQAEEKHEYLDGELVAMTGASRQHVRLVLNVAFALDRQLESRGCEVYASDMRVRIPAGNLYTYPDVAVACGEPHFDDADADTLLDPKLIVEVLSRSTADYDRGTKFVHYRTLPSLMEYLLIAQDRVHVEHFVRQADGQWLLFETEDLASILELPSLGCTLALRDVYRRVIPR